MCDDCVGRTITRRQVLWTPPAAVGAAALLSDSPAYGAERSVQRICRPAWGASPPTGVYVPHKISRITVHHSAVVLRDNRKAPAQLRAFQADHQSRGWPDIAYHLLIDRHGNLYQGRPLQFVGDTNTSYDPTGHLLVLALGNFQVQAMSSAQLNTVVSVLAWGCTRYGVAPRAIRGHRAYAETLCPGDRLQALITNGTVRKRVAKQLDQVKLRLVCGDAGERRVRRIENGTD
jgi:N-acetylmuramoyl-L-alanine amidase